MPTASAPPPSGFVTQQALSARAAQAVAQGDVPKERACPEAVVARSKEIRVIRQPSVVR